MILWKCLRGDSHGPGGAGGCCAFAGLATMEKMCQLRSIRPCALLLIPRAFKHQKVARRKVFWSRVDMCVYVGRRGCCLSSERGVGRSSKAPGRSGERSGGRVMRAKWVRSMKAFGRLVVEITPQSPRSMAGCVSVPPCVRAHNSHPHLRALRPCGENAERCAVL